jgi:hypothetical protein
MTKNALKHFDHRCPGCENTLTAAYIQRTSDHWPRVLLSDNEFGNETTCESCKHEFTLFELEQVVFSHNLEAESKQLVPTSPNYENSVESFLCRN